MAVEGSARNSLDRLPTGPPWAFAVPSDGHKAPAKSQEHCPDLLTVTLLALRVSHGAAAEVTIEHLAESLGSRRKCAETLRQSYEEGPFEVLL